jgi:hypothetical protein
MQQNSRSSHEGQSALPSSCPVCEHTPLAAEDCKPHKSLRTTIKVFLRTEEKKREALRLKELKNTPPVTPPVFVEIPAPSVAIPESTPTLSQGVTAETPKITTVHSSTAVEQSGEELASGGAELEESIDAQQDVPQPSIEVSV